MICEYVIVIVREKNTLEKKNPIHQISKLKHALVSYLWVALLRLLDHLVGLEGLNAEEALDLGLGLHLGLQLDLFPRLRFLDLGLLLLRALLFLHLGLGFDRGLFDNRFSAFLLGLCGQGHGRLTRCDL